MSVTAPKGFLASGIAAGIKENGAPDLALVSSVDGPVAAAATFTTNLAAAAPVRVSREHLERSGGRVAAVVLNSGCANAATGMAGMIAARRSCAEVARVLGVAEHEVLVCSTGLYRSGAKPLERLLARRPERSSRPQGPARRATPSAAATAIMTTGHAPEAGARPGRRARIHCRRHGKGRGDDRAEHGDHALGPHHRRGR